MGNPDLDYVIARKFLIDTTLTKSAVIFHIAVALNKKQIKKKLRSELN